MDLYDEGRVYIESVLLEAGDVILLAGGGHGFKVIEEVEMIEVQQGPYDPASHKRSFESVSERDIKFGGCDDTGK